jgi:hypothetical protein
MESETGGGSTLKEALARAFDSVIDSAPSLLAALLIIVVGWALARLASRAARHLAGLANRLLERSFRRGSAAAVRLSPAFITLVGELAFWLVVILAVILAAGVAGFGSVGQWLNTIVLHLPSLVVGATIVVVGFFFSVYLRELVTATGSRGGIGTAGAIGRLTQALVMTVAVIVGLDQAGVDVATVMILFTIVGGGLMLALVLAFGLGARDYVRNLIGARQARHFLQPGIRVRIGELEGEVLEISDTHVALDTTTGRTLLPARLLQTTPIAIITPGLEDGRAGG